MNKKLVFLSLTIIALIEPVFLSYLKVFGVAPNLLLSAIVILSFLFELRWVIIFAGFAGLLKDIFGIQYLGLNIILFSLWGYLSTKLSKNFSLANPIILPVSIFVIVAANSILTQAILIYLNQGFLLGAFLKNTFLEPIYSAIISLIIFRLFKDMGYLQKI